MYYLTVTGVFLLGLVSPQTNALTFEPGWVSTENDAVYITTEKYRPLKHLCETLLGCTYKFAVIYAKVDNLEEHSQQRHVTAEFHYLSSTSPNMNGVIKICIIRNGTFITGFPRAECIDWNPLSYILTNQTDTDNFRIEVDTWYMTIKNYEEMRNGVTTEVFIPYSKDLHSLQITVNIIHPYPLFACILIAPFGIRSIDGPYVLSTFSTTYKYNLNVSGTHASDIYTFKCTGEQYKFSSYAYFTKTASISLYLNFITVPKITIEDQIGYTVEFSPSSSSGGFIVVMYSLCKVTEYSFTKDDGKIIEVFVTLISHSEWEIVYRYQIGFPVLDQESDGNYTFSATDKDQKTTIQTMTIVKAQEMKSFADPERLEVIVGFLAVFECFVEGTVNYELEWSRDYEPLHHSKYLYKTEAIHVSGRYGLRLMLIDVQLNYSGIYSCTAENKFERIIKTVQLIVWPYDHEYLVDVVTIELSATEFITSVFSTAYQPPLKSTTIPFIPNDLEVCFVFLTVISVVVLAGLVVYWGVCFFWKFANSQTREVLKGWMVQVSQAAWFNKGREYSRVPSASGEMVSESDSDKS